MRIALLSEEDPGWGGIGTYTWVLGVALRELGHDVHLVLRGWEEDGSDTLEGLTVHRVVVREPTWRRGTVAAVSRLFVARESLIFSARAATVLAQIGAHVVEAPEFHAAGLLAALRGRFRRGAPSVVARLHAPSFITSRLAAQEPELDSRVCEALEAASVHSARSITSPSDALARAVRSRWRLARARIHVVPNPIDDNRFAPGADPDEQAVIVVVGRIERAKGQDILIEALPAILAAVPEAHIRLVGSDGGLADLLARRASELGVAERVALEGARPREELPSIYRSAAVCAVPSRFEAFGYTCVEAMACGRPVVAARAGGLAEIVSDGVDGRLVSPEDPQALADVLIELLRDAEQRRRLGAAARTRVMSSFAARTVAARMAVHYLELVA